MLYKTLKFWVGAQQSKYFSWGEPASLALVGHSSSDGAMIKTHNGVDVLLHRLASHPIFSCQVG